MHGLIDTTLREGAQKAGLYLTAAQKRSILRGLIAFGVEEIEIGRADEPAKALADLIAHARKLGARRLALWSRCTEADVLAGARLRPDVLSLSLPASDLLLREKIRKSRAQALALVADCAALARQNGISFLSLGLEDATRADAAFLQELLETAARAGIRRVRIADTVGVASPRQIADLVGWVSGTGRLEVGVHTHNDFGMATANAVAAIEAGADWADVSVLGLGERAGCARLEEVAGWLAVARGGKPYRLERLRDLCATVADAAGVPVAGNHPVVGRDIFTCETGLHLIGLFRDPETYEPFAPELVGGERRLLLGGKAGKRAVEERLRSLGCACAGERLRLVTEAIRARAECLRRPLRDAEVAALASNYAAPDYH